MPQSRLPEIQYPSLANAKLICIDIETCDPDLKTKGPGTHRGEGFIAGLAVGVDGWKQYFPMRHEGGGNLDPQKVLAWAKEELCRPGQPKLGAHILYDLEWLHAEGVPVAGPFLDVQYAEPLLDEHKYSYALENLAQEYLSEGKDSDYLYQYLADKFGGKPTRDKQAERIWRAPAHIVKPYAESDVDLPLRILDKQIAKLQEQGLYDLFDLECSLIPLLLAMRQQGVRVDVGRAEQLKSELVRRIEARKFVLLRNYNREVNFNAPSSIAPIFDKLGIEYPRTKTGLASFTTDWLKTQTHPVAQMISELKSYHKCLTTFVQGYILDMHVNGRVYGQFHPLRTGKYGTGSGRFSSSNPNLENIPTLDETEVQLKDNQGETFSMPLGKAVRSLFLPEKDEDWGKDDYSQIEYRIICHYGGKTSSKKAEVIRQVQQSAEAARRAYQENRETDFHKWVAAIAGIDRGPAKRINFGKAYGMGKTATAESLGVPMADAKAFLKLYDDRMPFVKELLKYVGEVAEARGYIKTILGRRARFPLFEPKGWGKKREKPLPFAAALEAYGQPLQRAKTYKALNALAQGTAADVIKAALRKIWEAGICEVLKAPRNLVHDEIDWSKPRTKEATEAHQEALHIMETAIEFSVPLVVEAETGPNWGEVTKEIAA